MTGGLTHRTKYELFTSILRMKQTALWLLTLVFALVMTGGVFPRAAMAAAATVGQASAAESGAGKTVAMSEAPAHEDPCGDASSADSQSATDTDDEDDVADEGLSLAHAGVVARVNRGARSTWAAPRLRRSQSFVGLHDKVPR